MSQMRYPHIFEPIRLGRQLFLNRLFAAPTGYRNMTYDSIYPEEALQYYRRKAMGGCAAVSTGELIVDTAFGRGSPNQICIDNPACKIPLGKLAFAISRYGAVPTAELTHAGMYANRTLAMFGGVSQGEAYGPVEMELSGRLIKEMPESMIEATIAKFAEAAATAKECGFGMIMVHMGHGWGLHQFLSPSLNTRKDKWGGSLENRCRYPIAMCQAVRKAVGPGFPIEVRISASECYAGGYGIDEGVAIAKKLEPYVDLIHASVGNHEVEEVMTVTHPSMFQPDGCNVQYAEAVKKAVGVPVAAVGALGEPEQMEEILASGKADVLEMARSLIADPDLPNKLRRGRPEEVRPCLRCLHCFSNQQLHGVKYCAVNPESGHEHETIHALNQSGPRKKVLVAGGGIGGMEAALTAAKNGHKVVLCEASGVLGGSIRCEEAVPFKQKLGVYLRRQALALEKAGVEVRLNTPVTPQLAESLEPDAIIAAFGARPIKPNIPGIDGPNVVSAEEVYKQPEKAGEKALILGGGLVGVELAIYLHMLGKQAEVVEMLDAIGDGGNIIHASALRVEIAHRNIPMHFGTRAEEITPQGVRCQDKEGKDVFYPAEKVIYAVGQRPLQEEALALKFCAPEFYMIGDCLGAKNIANATAQAHDVACNLGRI